MERVYILTLGCSKNTVDSEYMAGILKNDYIISDNVKNSDIVIINTCTFIQDAKNESIFEIFKIIELKKEGYIKKIVLAGCLSQRYYTELMIEIPEIDLFIGTSNYDKIGDFLISSEKKCVEDPSRKISENLPRVLIESNHYAYIKISEGCNNLCTYCIIPKIRGKYRSMEMESILNEAKELSKNGVKEIILIAQDTSKYGIDLYNEYSLHTLINKMSLIQGIELIRLHYLYPEDIYDELIDEIANNTKVANYIDMPIQHISDNILKKMNRKISKEQITLLVNKIRMRIPDVILRTTVIVGFPGETKEEFKELKEYVEKIGFDRLGVFKYSKEENTPASMYENQVHYKTKEKREKELMEIQKKISSRKNSEKTGKIFNAIIDEKIDSITYLGRTYMDSPEIDGCIFITSEKELLTGDILKVNITDSTEYDLIGEYYEFS